VVAVSTALGASHGLLVRNRVAFEGARKLQAVIFDKTGTLTEGRFGVTDTLLLAQDIDEEMLRSYASLGCRPDVGELGDRGRQRAAAAIKERRCGQGSGITDAKVLSIGPGRFTERGTIG